MFNTDSETFLIYSLSFIKLRCLILMVIYLFIYLFFAILFIIHEIQLFDKLILLVNVFATFFIIH